MPLPLIPLIAAAAPLLGGALSGIGGASAQRNANRANQRMAEYQYGRDLHMWNLQNAYNTPAAQMQRFKDAGLNPNMIYGQGNPGNATVLPKYSRAEQQPVDYVSPIGGGVLDVLGSFQDYQVKQAQIDNLKANNELIRENIGLAATRQNMMATQSGTLSATQPYSIMKAKYDAMRKEQEYDQKSELFPYSLEYAKGRIGYQSSQVDKMIFDMQKTKASTEYQKLQNEWYLTKLFGGMATDIIKAIPQLKNSMFSGSKSIKPTKVAPNAPKVRYNSPTSWRNILDE